MVLVAGGIKNLALNLPDSHLYDPKTDQWIETRSLPIGVTNPHGFMRSIVLPNGQVLIAGGEDDNSVETVGGTSALVHSNNAYLFTLNERHPSLSSWDYTRVKANNKISRMPEGRTTSGLVLLKDGRVLNVGGLGPAFDGLLSATNTASIFDPQTGIWSKAAPMPAVFGLEEDEIVPPYPTAPGSRWGPMAERLDNGQVLVAGGFGGVFFQFFRRSALLYDPTTNSWQMTTPTSFRRYIGSWSATLPAGAGILLAGPAFSDDYGLRNVTGEIFHPESGTWTPAPVPAGPLPPADSFESQLLRLSTGRVQIAGGINFFGPNAESGSWILREKNP